MAEIASALRMEISASPLRASAAWATSFIGFLVQISVSTVSVTSRMAPNSAAMPIQKWKNTKQIAI